MTIHRRPLQTRVASRPNQFKRNERLLYFGAAAAAVAVAIQNLIA